MKIHLKSLPAAFFLVCLLVLLSGCSTTTETDPSKVSWGDLIRGDRLDAHLASKRQELSRLEQQSSALEQRLLQKKSQLKTLDNRVQTARKTSSSAEQELADLNDEITVKQAELESVLSKLQELKSEEQNLREGLAALNEDKREMDEKLVRHELEIEQLESEVVVLEKAIDRILLVRAKHALGES